MEAGLVAICLVSLLSTFVIGSHWPLVGDSVLMHYVVFLTQHGFAPYRDIAEMNLPFTYLSEALAMRVFGGGDVGWRLYDGVLVLAIVVCSWRLLRECGLAAGLFASALFAAVHLQDGIHMAGQRDLLVTVLQAAAACVLLSTVPGGQSAAQQRSRGAQLARVGLFGLLSTAAACIKPPAILFGVAGLVWLWLTGPRTGVAARRSVRLFVAALAGGCIPLLMCVGYLLHFGALNAFLHDLHGLVAYHASLERRSLGFLLGHIWSPVLPFLLLTLLAAALRTRVRWSPGDTMSALAAVAGLLSYVIQGKGFPYQRYPFLLWALLWCASRLWASLQDAETYGGATGDLAVRRTPAPAFAAVLAIVSGVVLMGMFLLRSTHFSHADPYAGLRADLIANRAAALNGRVQCLDTAGPCVGAMYEARLTQSTGFLYDCYLLDGSNAVVQQQRTLLQQEWAQRPPRLVVLTDSNCFTGARTFDKYRSWPWMQQQLAEYNVMVERHPMQPLRLWSRPEQPYAYRILLRR